MLFLCGQQQQQQYHMQATQRKRPKSTNQTTAVTNKGAAEKETDCIHNIYVNSKMAMLLPI